MDSSLSYSIDQLEEGRKEGRKWSAILNLEPHYDGVGLIELIGIDSQRGGEGQWRVNSSLFNLIISSVPSQSKVCKYPTTSTWYLMMMIKRYLFLSMPSSSSSPLTSSSLPPLLSINKWWYIYFYHLYLYDKLHMNIFTKVSSLKWNCWKMSLLQIKSKIINKLIDIYMCSLFNA